MLKLKLMVVPVIGCLLLSAGISRAQVTNTMATAMDVYDGFETAVRSLAAE
jgi:hypothetical protein